MSRKSLASLLALTLIAPLAQADDVDRLGSWESKAYSLIIPAEKDVRWQKIPWLTDLGEAVKAAKAEKRPMLVWTTDDDPLERC